MPDLPNAIVELAPVPAGIDQLVEMTIATCISPQTRRVYRIHITRFLKDGKPLSREGVAMHIQSLRDSGASSATLLGALAAVKKLASEAHVRGLMTFEAYANIKSLSGGKQQKARAGNWMTLAQAQQFMDLPDRTTYQGKRDAAILGLLLGCALRRAEMATLRWDNYQERDGRMCLVDFTGKGNKRRTIPVPLWVQPDVDAWRLACGTPDEPVTPAQKATLAHRKVDNDLITGGLGYEGLFDLVESYGNKMGLNIAPHDLRRTLAQMLRKNGAPLEQIRDTLGHQDIATTVIYLGSTLELEPEKAAVDQLRLRRTR